MATKIGSSPVFTPQVSATSNSPLAPATTPAAAPQVTDSFTPSPTTDSNGTPVPALIQKANDVLTKNGSDTANQLKALLAKPSPTNDDVTKMNDLYGQLKDSGMSADDLKTVGAGMSSKIMIKTFIDQMLDSVKNMKPDVDKD